MRSIRANGERITTLREALDITQEQLSAKVGYSVKTLWKAESGGRLRRRTLADIATALGVTYSEISLPDHGIFFSGGEWFDAPSCSQSRSHAAATR